MADNFFCLELGESFIKLADIKRADNQLMAERLGFIETDPSFFVADNEKINENQASAIGKLVNSLKVTKKTVNIVIPDAFTYSQILEMPRLNEKELISAIRYQADQFIPMPIEEANIDIEILSENEKEKIITLMVAAPKKLIERVQRTIELSGLIPESLENELSASGRFLSECYKTLYQNAGGAVIIINFGFSSTSLYFFNPQTSLIAQNHTFNIGYNLFLKEIQVNLSTDQKKTLEILKAFDLNSKASYSIEAIIAPLIKEFSFEIKRFINLIADKYQSSIKNIYIINEAARFPAIPKMIEKVFSIPTQMLNPYNIFSKSLTIEQNRLNLPLFISTIGGNLR